MKKLFYSLYASFVLGLAAIPEYVFADAAGVKANLKKGAEAAFGTQLVKKQADGREALPQMVGQVLEILLSLLGVVFMILVIYAGLMWMFSRGDSEQAKKAMRILTSSTLGLAVVVLAYAITQFVLSVIFSAVG